MVFSGYSGFLHQQTDCHDITEILLKVALNTITITITENLIIAHGKWLLHNSYK
jgi:hypothetical protein